MSPSVCQSLTCRAERVGEPPSGLAPRGGHGGGRRRRRPEPAGDGRAARRRRSTWHAWRSGPPRARWRRSTRTTAELVYVASVGAGAAETIGLRLPLGRGIAGYAAASGETVAVDDVTHDPRFARDVAERTGYVPRSVLVAPIMRGDDVLGVLSVLDRTQPAGAAALDLAARSARASAARSSSAPRPVRWAGPCSARSRPTTAADRPDVAATLAAVARDDHDVDDETARVVAASPRCGRLGPAERNAAAADPRRVPRVRRGAPGPPVSTVGAPRVVRRVPARPARPAPDPRAPGRHHAGVGLRRRAGHGVQGRGHRLGRRRRRIPAVGPGRGRGDHRARPRRRGRLPRRRAGPHRPLRPRHRVRRRSSASLAPGVELYSVRVLGEKLTGRARCFAGGIDWAIEPGMHVVNLSLSTTNEDWFAPFHDLADQALHRRVMLVERARQRAEGDASRRTSRRCSRSPRPRVTTREVFAANPRRRPSGARSASTSTVAWIGRRRRSPRPATRSRRRSSRG